MNLPSLFWYNIFIIVLYNLTKWWRIFLWSARGKVAQQLRRRYVDAI